MTHKHTYSIPSADDQNDARCIECGRLQPTTQLAKHTPGPWAVEGDNNGYMIVGPGQCYIADICASDGLVNENDAALIAAAPAMYEALKELVTYLHNHVEDEVLDNWAPVLKAAYALAQAEGKQ